MKNIEFLIYFILLLKYKEKEITKEDIEGFFPYINEICSYNGVPSIESSKEGKYTVKCKCDDYFANNPIKKEYIRGEEIQCSYKKKQRLIVFFLALVLPFGFDYLYLGYIFFFVVIFLVVLGALICQIICFCKNNKFNEQSEEPRKFENERIPLNKDEEQDRRNSNDGNKDKKKEKNKLNRILITIQYIGYLSFVIFWVINFVFQYLGKIPDVNGIETYNDLIYLFRLEDL